MTQEELNALRLADIRDDIERIIDDQERWGDDNKCACCLPKITVTMRYSTLETIVEALFPDLLNELEAAADRCLEKRCALIRGEN